jgi:hypothetical protein
LYVDATLVNTDSFPGYFNVQYGQYYDNVNLKIRFRLGEIPVGYSSVPVIVATKIYGITSSGTTTHLYTAPNVYYYVGSPAYYEYVLPNIYYLQPNYSAYKIVTYARPIYSSTFVQQTSFVYVDPTITVPTTVLDPPTQPSYPSQPITDYYLSGQKDIYLDEYEEYYYDLKIVNNSDQELHLTSIQTTNPTRIDIKGISYSNTVYPNSTGYATIKLVSSGVSSDYSGSFDISVVGRYGNNPDVQKTYDVTYHIFDEYSTNTGACKDVSLENYSFVFEDNQVYVKDLEINNDSRDYDFEITDVYLQDYSTIKTRIINYPSKINKRDSDTIKAEFITSNLNNNISTSLKLKIYGKLKRDGYYSKNCEIEDNIRITVKDVVNTLPTSTNCSNIQIFAPTIRQIGNDSKQYSLDNGFFIKNQTNQKFNINNLLITTTTNKASITTSTYSDYIYPSSTYPLSFRINTQEVTTTLPEKIVIKLNGIFDDGTFCNYSDISKTIDFSILGTEDKCSQVGLVSKIVTNGSNNISVFNETNQDFYIESFLISNKHDLQASVNNQQQTIYKKSSKETPISFSGNGSLEILFKGRFDDGSICEYYSTTSGVYTSQKTQYNLSNNNECLVNLQVPTSFEVKNKVEHIDFSFVNNTYKGGKITITGQGLAVSPSVINLGGYDSFNETIALSNFDNPKMIYYTVSLTDCEKQTFFTNISQEIDFSQRIDILSFPEKIKPINNNVNINVDLKNTYSGYEEVSVMLTGFPNTWLHQAQKIVFAPMEVKTVSLFLTVDDLKANKEYHGYIEVRKGSEILHKKQLIIDLLNDQEKIDVSYSMTKLDELRFAYLLKINLRNNMSTNKDLIISFTEKEALKENLVIEGSKEIYLQENELQEIEFKIVSPKAIGLNDLNVSFLDKTTNQVLDEINIVPEKTSLPILSGFFVLGSAQNIVLFLLIIVIVSLIVYRFRKKKKM